MGGPIPDAVPKGDSGAQPGASGQGFPAREVARVQQGYGVAYGGDCAPMANFSTGTVDSGGVTFNGKGADAGTVRPGEGAVKAPGDGNLEMPKSQITEASSAKDANLIIHKDGTSEFNASKPVGPPDYSCSVFRESGAKSEDVATQIEKAKEELGKGLHVVDNKKVDLQNSELPEFLTKETATGESETGPKEDSPDGSGGKGGKGGGCDTKPADDKADPAEKEEEETKPEGGQEPGEGNAQPVTLKDDIKENVKSNVRPNDQARNVASYAGSLWNSSPMMSSLFSTYDLDGDGELSEEERAAMEKDPKYADAMKEMQDKAGNDPAMKDFKDQIGTREGLNNLSKLQRADANGTATPADAGKVFNDGAQSAIMDKAISQQLQAAGHSSTETLSSSASAAEQAAYKAKIQAVVDTLVNKKHIFSF